MTDMLLSLFYIFRSSALAEAGVIFFFLGPVIAIIGLIIAIVGAVTQNRKIVFRGLWTILAGLLCSIGGFTLCSMNMNMNFR